MVRLTEPTKVSLHCWGCSRNKRSLKPITKSTHQETLKNVFRATAHLLFHCRMLFFFNFTIQNSRHFHYIPVAIVYTKSVCLQQPLQCSVQNEVSVLFKAMYLEEPIKLIIQFFLARTGYIMYGKVQENLLKRYDMILQDSLQDFSCKISHINNLLKPWKIWQDLTRHFQ